MDVTSSAAELGKEPGVDMKRASTRSRCSQPSVVEREPPSSAPC